MDGLSVLGLSGVAVLLAAIGGVLGGALGHWQRGRGGALTGAIIGALALPLAAIAWLLQVWMLIVGAVILAVVAALGGFLG